MYLYLPSLFIPDFNGHWKNSHSQFVDFSDFPNFDQHTGELGDTIVWVLKPTGAILFPIHPELLSVNHFIFFPICSVAIIKAGRCIYQKYVFKKFVIFLNIISQIAQINIHIAMLGPLNFVLIPIGAHGWLKIVKSPADYANNNQVPLIKYYQPT